MNPYPCPAHERKGTGLPPSTPVRNWKSEVYKEVADEIEEIGRERRVGILSVKFLADHFRKKVEP